MLSILTILIHCWVYTQSNQRQQKKEPKQTERALGIQ